MLKRLQAQHHADLRAYRSAHRKWWDVLLHKTLIVPIECWTETMLLLIVVELIVPKADNERTAWVVILVKLLPRSITLLLGTLSLLLATSRWVGLATLVFHIMVIYSCEKIMELYMNLPLNHPNWWIFPIIAHLSWSLPLILRGVVGLFVVEDDAPNGAKKQKVSYLAICQPVLIAWSI